MIVPGSSHCRVVFPLPVTSAQPQYCGRGPLQDPLSILCQLLALKPLDSCGIEEWTIEALTPLTHVPVSLGASRKGELL